MIEQGVAEQAAEKFRRDHLATSQSANIPAPTSTSISQDNLNQTCSRRESEQLRTTSAIAAVKLIGFGNDHKGGIRDTSAVLRPFCLKNGDQGAPRNKLREKKDSITGHSGRTQNFATEL